jgi:hypothetical protein
VTWDAEPRTLHGEEWALRDARRRVTNLECELARTSADNARMRRQLTELRRVLEAGGLGCPPVYPTCESVVQRVLAEHAAKTKSAP